MSPAAAARAAAATSFCWPAEAGTGLQCRHGDGHHRRRLEDRGPASCQSKICQLPLASRPSQNCTSPTTCPSLFTTCTAIDDELASVPVRWTRKSFQPPSDPSFSNPSPTTIFRATRVAVFSPAGCSRCDPLPLHLDEHPVGIDTRRHRLGIALPDAVQQTRQFFSSGPCGWARRKRPLLGNRDRRPARPRRPGPVKL